MTSSGLESLKETLIECGIDLDVTSSGLLHNSLMHLRSQYDEHTAQVRNEMINLLQLATAV